MDLAVRKPAGSIGPMPNVTAQAKQGSRGTVAALAYGEAPGAMLRTGFRVEVYNSVEDTRPPLKERLLEIVENTFGLQMKTEISTLLMSSDRLLVAFNPNSVAVGFATAEFYNWNDSMLLSSAVVEPSSRRLGIYGQFAVQRIALGLLKGYDKVIVWTQNPVVEYQIRKALATMSRRGCFGGFSLSRVYGTAFYGYRLTDRIQRSKSAKLNAIYGRLDYERGDAYELLFTITGARERMDPSLWDAQKADIPAPQL
jgi:hypothetical protein